MQPGCTDPDRLQMVLADGLGERAYDHGDHGVRRRDLRGGIVRVRPSVKVVSTRWRARPHERITDQCIHQLRVAAVVHGIALAKDVLAERSQYDEAQLSLDWLSAARAASPSKKRRLARQPERGRWATPGARTPHAPMPA